MPTIDVEALRQALVDYYGTAVMSGFPAAMAELAEVESLSPGELCERARSLGIDLRRFEPR